MQLGLTSLGTILDVATDLMRRCSLILLLSSSKSHSHPPRMHALDAIFHLAYNNSTVLSIPIIILRMSGLRPSQKLGLATFLCLSIAMVACSLTRNFGAQKKTGHGKPDFDTIWQVLWLQIVCFPSF